MPVKPIDYQNISEDELPYLTFNEASQFFNKFHRKSVISRVSTPPLSPSTYDKHIIESGTGDFTGLDNHWAMFDGGSLWRTRSPELGYLQWQEDVNRHFYWNGTNYQKLDEQIGTASVNVETLDDFPAPIAGFIYLEAGKQYILNKPIVTPYTFVPPASGSCMITSTDPSTNVLVYVGGSSLFYSNGLGYLYLDSLVIVGQVAIPTQKLFNISNPLSQSGFVKLQTVFIQDFNDLGSVSDVNFFSFVVLYRNCGVGITLLNNFSVAIVTNFFDSWQNLSNSTCLNFAGFMNFVQINNSFFFIDSNMNAIDFNSASFFLRVTITGSLFLKNPFNSTGSVFKSGSLDQSNVFFKVSGNSGTGDSAVRVYAYSLNNVTITTFTANLIPTYLLSTFTQSIGERVSVEADGTIRYFGIETVILGITITIYGTNTSGTTIEFSHYLVKGNYDTGTGASTQAISSFADAGGGQVTVTTTYAHGLQNNTRIMIVGTTNYDGYYIITNVSTYTFEITATFVATETGRYEIIIEDSKSPNVYSSTAKITLPVVFQGSASQWDYVRLVVERGVGGSSGKDFLAEITKISVK